MTFTENIKDLGKHGSIYMVGWMANCFLRLALLPVFTRFLDQSEYGMLAILDSGIELIRILCALGLGAAIIRFFHEYEEESDRNKIVSTGLTVLLVVAIISGAVLYLLRRPLTLIILGDEGYSLYFCLAANSMLFGVVRAGSDSYLNARKASKIFVLVNSGQAALNSCINLYLVVAKDMGVLGMLIGNLVSALIVNSILFVVIIKHVSLRIDKIKLGKMLKFSLPLVLSLFAAAGMHNLDRFFIRIYASMADVGLYSLAYQFPFLMSAIFIESFERIWGGDTMYKIAKAPDAVYQYSRICTYFMGVLALALYSTSIAAKTIVGVFAAPGYASASKYIPVVSLGVWLYSLHVITKVGVTLTKKTYLFPVNYLLSLIVNVVSCLLLVPRFGAMGAAYATVLTYAWFSIGGYLIYRHCYPLTIEWHRLGIIALLGICLVLLRSLVDVEGFIGVLVVDVATIVVYPLILFVFPGFLTEGERSKLNELKELGMVQLSAVLK